MADAASAPAHMWFVKTGGEVWGPYPQDRVTAFVREGRVRPTTSVSPFAAGPWTPAADAAEFAPGFRPAPSTPLPPAPISAPAASPSTRPAPEPNDPADEAFPPAAHLEPLGVAPAPAGPERALLVFAELASVTPAAFHEALGRFGRCAQVRPSLWLLRAPTTAAALRNRLSSRLAAGDVLLVIEAPLDQAAWFNLAPAHDRELRRLWTGG